MHILTSLLVSSSDFLLIQYLSNSCKTWQNEGIGSITWNMQNGKNEDKKKGKTRNCQWPQIWNFSTSCMCVMWRMSPHICKIYSVLLYNRCCHNLRCFVAKYVLLRFMHFCVEKIQPKIAYVVKKWQIWAPINQSLKLQPTEQPEYYFKFKRCLACLEQMVDL